MAPPTGGPIEDGAALAEAAAEQLERWSGRLLAPAVVVGAATNLVLV